MEKARTTLEELRALSSDEAEASEPRQKVQRSIDEEGEKGDGKTAYESDDDDGDDDDEKYSDFLSKVDAALRNAAKLGATRAELKAKSVKLWLDNSGSPVHQENVARMYLAERGGPMPNDVLSFGTWRKARFPRYRFSFTYSDRHGTELETMIELPVSAKLTERKARKTMMTFFRRLDRDLPFVKKGSEFPRKVWEWK